MLGDSFFISLTLFSLIAVATTLNFIFIALKIFGAMYLCWLGYGLLRRRVFASSRNIEKSSVFVSLMGGLLITLADMKAIFFYISLLPAFIDITTLTLTEALIILLIDAAAVGGAKSGYAYIASSASRLASRKAFQHTRVISSVAGVAMIIVAVILMMDALFHGSV